MAAVTAFISDLQLFNLSLVALGWRAQGPGLPAPNPASTGDEDQDAHQIRQRDLPAFTRVLIFWKRIDRCCRD